MIGPKTLLGWFLKKPRKALLETCHQNFGFSLKFPSFHSQLCPNRTVDATQTICFLKQVHKNYMLKSWHSRKSTTLSLNYPLLSTLPNVRLWENCQLVPRPPPPTGSPRPRCTAAAAGGTPAPSSPCASPPGTPPRPPLPPSPPPRRSTP